MAEFYEQNTEFNPKKFLPILLVVLGAIIILGFGSKIFVKIDFGQKGVVYKLLSGGMDKEVVYDQGLHFIFPWNQMHIYDVKIQEATSIMQVLSKNGLTIKMEVSYRYKPVEAEIGYLHDEVGQGYHETVIIPEIRSAAREVIGKYLPEELYSTKREAIEDEIFNMTQQAIASKHLLIDAVLIRDVELPLTLQQAIENKLKQEQMALEYEFRIEGAKKEAERKIIEAQGKSDAFNIISKSLTDKILTEKGIEATLELAKSPNAKIVVVGGGKNGLPIILNGN